ncbi:unnamed protein product [Prunus armeniaca]
MVLRIILYQNKGHPLILMDSDGSIKTQESKTTSFGSVGHVDEDVDTISGGECHGSHIDKCYRDSVGTSMHLRCSLSVEWRELKS